MGRAARNRQAPKALEAIDAFIRSREVRSVVMTDRIIGCPHEEGIDYCGLGDSLE